MSDLRLLSIREAAAALNRPYLAVYRLAKSGVLPTVQFPGVRRIFIRADDLEKVIARLTRQEAA